MPAPGTRRREAPEVRVEQLLDSAEAVLLERGLQAATIADIASRAGVAKGTVYLYFDSKQSVLAALRRRHVEGIETSMRAAVANIDGRADRIRAAIVALMKVGTERPALHHLLFQEAGISEDDAFEPVGRLLVELIQPAGRATDLTIEFVLGGIHAALVRAAHAPQSKRAAMGRQVAELVMMVVDHDLAPPAG